MAGRFLTLEEVARQLGVSVDEVNRFVDRKKLFPMRDGATVKFRADDVDKVAEDLGADLSRSEDLSLDLDLPAPSRPTPSPVTDELVLGDPIDAGDLAIDDGGAAASISRTILRSDPIDAPAAPPAAPAVASVFDDLGGDGDDALSLEPLDSIVGASSPSLARQSQAPSTGIGMGPGDSLAINLSNLGSGTGGSGGSAPGLSSGDATIMLSGSIDSGLSLEGDGASVTSGEASVVYPAESSGMFGADEFILGSETEEEESASVVIATEETGDSSFFGDAIAGEGSTFGAASESAVSSSVSAIPAGLEFTLDTPFSGLQIAGLICCSLLLLGGGFVVFDLVRTLGSTEGPMLANPVLDRIAETFGWR